MSDDFFILHVDDEDLLRESFADGLKDCGVTIKSAGSGEEALAIVRESAAHICMVIADIQMPNMSGFGLREELLKSHPQIPFAIVSAHIDRDIALEGLKNKIAAFLSKPFDFTAITSLIEKEALPRLRVLKEDYELKKAFIADGESLVEEADEILLDLETTATFSAERVNRLYGIIHTLKGSSAFFDSKDLHRFLHAYEDVLKKVQRSEVEFNSQTLQVLVSGFGIAKTLFEEFRTNSFPPRDFKELLKVIDLKLLGANAPSMPLSTAKTEPKKADTAEPAKKKLEEIKVPVKRLDEFMQLSGDVTVIRNMLNKCVSGIERRFAGDRDVQTLAELLSELHKVNSKVQNKITEIRKVSLRSVYKSLPRAVKEVSQSLGKKTQFETVGEELLVDTSIAEVLNICLLHIIKNSLDHGIESADKRKAAGKSEIGQIKVSTSIRDEKVLVEISDDGRGLNPEAIKQKCINNGSHTLEQLEKMSEEDIFAMIFSSGFSTAEHVTEISGRGVGMSMVKDSVEGIGGKIRIHSELGKGARFTLELPVPKSVMIASCLGVKLGNHHLSLPQGEILKVFLLEGKERDHLKEVEGGKVLEFNGKLVPVADLAELLQTDFTQPDSLRTDSTGSAASPRGPLILMETQDQRQVVIEVDEILEAEEMVIKPLNPTLNPKAVFRGVTFLDDGTVGLVLNVAGVVDALNLKELKSESSKPSEKIKEAHDEELLTVEIAGLGQFGLLTRDIYRIENFSLKAVTNTGEQEVVAYRQKVMSYINLSNLLPQRLKREAFVIDPSSVKTMVVFEIDKQFVGVGVSQVLDAKTFSRLSEELAHRDEGLLGHLLEEKSSIPVLDVKKLLDARGIRRTEPTSSAA